MKKAIFLFLSLALAACQPPAEKAATAPETAPMTEGASTPPSEHRTLRVLTHGSFTLPEELVSAFEAKHNATIELIEAEDAGSMLSRMRMTKDNPIADAVYGLDNNVQQIVIDEQLLETPATLANTTPHPLEPESGLTAINYGLVALNYDRAAWAKTGLPLPDSLEDFHKNEYAKQLVLLSPLTSSPGMTFFAKLSADMGTEAALDWWKKAEAAGAKTAAGWSDAYYNDFSGSGGDRAIVLSYTSSPAAGVFYADGFDPNKLPAEAPTANLLLPGSVAKQIEGAGVIKGGKQPELAKEWIHWLRSVEVQEAIPTSMWVYPVVKEAKLNPVFELAPQPDSLPGATRSDPQKLLDAWVNGQRQ